jgi:hypothetical protein
VADTADVSRSPSMRYPFHFRMPLAASRGEMRRFRSSSFDRLTERA